jgi:hypothetical protein
VRIVTPPSGRKNYKVTTREKPIIDFDAKREIKIEFTRMNRLNVPCI